MHALGSVWACKHALSVMLYEYFADSDPSKFLLLTEIFLCSSGIDCTVLKRNYNNTLYKNYMKKEMLTQTVQHELRTTFVSWSEMGQRDCYAR